jgi:hypothetical protein
MYSAPFSVFVDVCGFRQDEAQKRFALETTGLCDTKQTEVLNRAPFTERA